MNKNNSGRKQCILIVEDHQPLLRALQTVLEAQSFTVLAASDGLQALQLMEKSLPDLIVSDINMPRLDGYALYRAVRARPEWVPIPFVFLTARGHKEDVLKGKGLGAEDYLTKPVSPQELVVTIRARLERSQAIRQAREAEFEQHKEQIITILSHELRTPLSHVLGFTDLALDDALTLDREELRQFLSLIKKGAERLSRLFDNFILLVQLESGQGAKGFHELSSIQQDLAAVIRSTVRPYQAQAAERNLVLEMAIRPELPPVRLHPSFFVDALGRLLDNACKFSHGEGKRVTVSAQADNGWLEVAVSDEGVGIPADKLAHLFERFRQIDRERMEQQGTGLGLAIAQGLIRLHGGEITAESEFGVGSTFTIRLPAAGSG